MPSFRTKSCLITALYRSPSQSLEEFEIFKNCLENTIVKINERTRFLVILLSGFNAKNTLLCSGDIINSEGLELNELFSHYYLYINLLILHHILFVTHVLIFYLHPKQILYQILVFTLAIIKLFSEKNLNVFYPPPYERLVWDYTKDELTNFRVKIGLNIVALMLLNKRL